MPLFQTLTFGAIQYEKTCTIRFPDGWPGFEERQRLAALTFADSERLVFLRSLVDRSLCSITLPILAIDGHYRLELSAGDLPWRELRPEQQPRIGEEVACLRGLTFEEGPPRPICWRPSSSSWRTVKPCRACAGVRVLAPACVDAGRGVDMLIMSRRERDTILIGDEIEMVIAHIGRTRVKVGIQAPRAMALISHELKLIREQNLPAARAASSFLRSTLRLARPVCGHQTLASSEKAGARSP